MAGAWGSDYRRIEAFANTVFLRTKDVEGASVYARLYELGSPILHHKQAFDLGAVNWDRMKAGYERIRTDYPQPWNVNQFAYFACIAGDLDTLSKLVPEVEKAIVREVWGSPVLYEHCKATAMTWWQARAGARPN